MFSVYSNIGKTVTAISIKNETWFHHFSKLPHSSKSLAERE